MPNYFICNKESNLVINVVASSSPPAPAPRFSYFVASEKALDTYDKWLIKHKVLPDIGWLMGKHPYLLP